MKNLLFAVRTGLTWSYTRSSEPKWRKDAGSVRTNWTPKRLRAFEEQVAHLFRQGKIKAPIHLGDGSETPLIEVFQEIQPEDWVLAAWRSHYHCLLKGVPEAE